MRSRHHAPRPRPARNDTGSYKSLRDQRPVSGTGRIKTLDAFRGSDTDHAEADTNSSDAAVHCSPSLCGTSRSTQQKRVVGRHAPQENLRCPKII